MTHTRPGLPQWHLSLAKSLGWLLWGIHELMPIRVPDTSYGPKIVSLSSPGPLWKHQVLKEQNSVLQSCLWHALLPIPSWVPEDAAPINYCFLWWRMCLSSVSHQKQLGSLTRKLDAHTKQGDGRVWTQVCRTQSPRSFCSTPLRGWLWSLPDWSTNFCLVITLKNWLILQVAFMVTRTAEPFSTIPELVSNYQPRSQESKCHIFLSFFLLGIAVCLDLKKKKETTVWRCSHSKSISSLRCHQSQTHKKKKKRAGPSTYPCELFLRKSCRPFFFPLQETIAV